MTSRLAKELGLEDVGRLVQVDNPQIHLSDVLVNWTRSSIEPEQMQILYRNEVNETVVLKARGTAIPPGSQQRSVPVTVACKIVHGADALQRLEKEYSVYDRLRSLQGLHIPICYGLFHCDAVEERGPTACLLLEYGGKTLSDTSEDIHAVICRSWSFRSV